MGNQFSFDDRFDSIRDAIFRASLDPRAWSEVVGMLATATDDAAAHFLGQDASYVGTDHSAIAGYDPAAEEPFEKYFQFINPLRAGWATLAAGSHCSHHSIMGEEQWRQSEYYNDWLKPQNLTGAVGVVLAQDHGRVFLLGIQTRDEATERFAAQLCARLFPILRHAVDVNRAMMGLRLDALSLRVGPDPEAAAILVLTGRGSVAYANPRADDMLAAGQVISLAPTGKLRAHDVDLQSRIDIALRAKGGSARLSLGGKTNPLIADLVPFGERLAGDIVAGPLGHMLDPRLVLILSRPCRPDNSEDRIRTTLGLTPTEAGVALALAAGQTPAEIAEARQTSIHTVRNQVKSVLLKTGCGRQSELAALVERLRRTP